jgi:hypothetical protein
VEHRRRWEYWLAASVVGFATMAWAVLWFADAGASGSEQRLLGSWRLANPRDPKLVRVIEFSRDGTALSFDLSPGPKAGGGIPLRWWIDGAGLTIADDQDEGFADLVRRVLGSKGRGESFPILSIGDDELVLGEQAFEGALIFKRLKKPR